MDAVVSYLLRETTSFEQTCAGCWHLNLKCNDGSKYEATSACVISDITVYSTGPYRASGALLGHRTTYNTQVFFI